MWRLYFLLLVLVGALGLGVGMDFVHSKVLWKQMLGWVLAVPSLLLIIALAGLVLLMGI